MADRNKDGSTQVKTSIRNLNLLIHRLSPAADEDSILRDNGIEGLHIRLQSVSADLHIDKTRVQVGREIGGVSITRRANVADRLRRIHRNSATVYVQRC